MTMVYVGGMSIGESVPTINGALLSAIGDVQARATALASFAPSIVPPSVAADLQVNAAILANLQLSIGITPPSIDLQVSIMATALAVVEAALAVLVNVMNLLGVSGLHVYHYSGTAAAMSADVAATIGTGLPGGLPGDAIEALVLVTQLPVCWSAIQGLFKTAP